MLALHHSLARAEDQHRLFHRGPALTGMALIAALEGVWLYAAHNISIERVVGL